LVRYGKAIKAELRKRDEGNWMDRFAEDKSVRFFTEEEYKVGLGVERVGGRELWAERIPWTTHQQAIFSRHRLSKQEADGG